MSRRFNLNGRVGFRTATSADLSRVRDLIRQYYKFDDIPFDGKAIRSGLKILLRNPALGEVWLVEDGALPVGYLVFTFGFDLEFGGRQATVTDFYLAPKYRGTGLGRKALKRVFRRLRTLGVPAVELQVSENNSRALAFYKRLGFQAHARIPMSRSTSP